MTTLPHAHTPTPQLASAGPPSIHERNNSIGSTGSSNQSIDAAPTAPPPTFRQDPLAAFERAMLAHPTGHKYWRRHHRRHHTGTGDRFLAPPPLFDRLRGRSHSRSRSASRTPNGGRSPSHSPSPTPAARRCMKATAAWQPSLDRRQSWNGQDYRREMMMQGTGLGCQCHQDDEDGQKQGRHHHRQPAFPATPVDMLTSRCVYEADRGFSEVNGSDQV